MFREYTYLKVQNFEGKWGGKWRPKRKEKKNKMCEQSTHLNLIYICIDNQIHARIMCIYNNENV